MSTLAPLSSLLLREGGNEVLERIKHLNLIKKNEESREEITM